MPRISAQPVPRPASLDAVATYAWDTEVFTATDAMAATGLTRSTAIEAMDSLVQLGLLRELPNAREAGVYRLGRPARRFELRADGAVLVGVDAGHVHVTARVTDLRSRALSTHRVEREMDVDNPATRREVIVAAVDAALGEAGCTRKDVIAMCAGVAAPVDARGRSPYHRDAFWERMNPGLMDAFAKWAPLVRVENDASLAAVAEGAFGEATGSNNYIALLGGTRLGAGVVVDGQVLRGAHGGVGEMVAFEHVKGVGGADGLGMRAAQWAAAEVARGMVTGDGGLAAIPPDRIDGQTVLELAASGDPSALRIAGRVGGVLARTVSVLGSMFDPERVVICGAISEGIDEVVKAARAALPTGLDLPAPELLVSRLGADVVVTGAVRRAAIAARADLLDLWESRVGA